MSTVSGAPSVPLLTAGQDRFWPGPNYDLPWFSVYDTESGALVARVHARTEALAVREAAYDLRLPVRGLVAELED